MAVKNAVLIKCTFCGKECKGGTGLATHCRAFHADLMKAPRMNGSLSHGEALGEPKAESVPASNFADGPTIYAKIKTVKDIAEKVGGLSALIEIARGIEANDL
jgi:hypothetical protein